MEIFRLVSTTLAGGVTHRLTQDISVSGNCFGFSGSNVILDLNGHTVSGNGSGNGINLAYGQTNIRVVNGTIDNFSNAFYQSHNSNTVQNVYSIENVNISNSNYAVYVDSWQNSRDFIFKNVSIEDDIYFHDVRTVAFLQDTIIDQNLTEMFRFEGSTLILNTTNTRMFGYLDIVGVINNRCL